MTRFGSVRIVLRLAGVFAIAAMGTWTSSLMAEPNGQVDSPTHRQIRVLRPQIDGKTIAMHSMLTDADGHLLVALGGKTYDYTMINEVADSDVQQPPGYVLQMDSQGVELARWKLQITPTAIALAADNTLFVGGSGKVAKLGANGMVEKIIDSPHIGDRKTFAKRTIEAQRRLMQAFLSEDSLKPLRDMLEQLEEKPEDERSRVEEAQLSALKTQLEQMEQLIGSQSEPEEVASEEEAALDPMMEMQIEQAMGVTSLAASQDYIFVCASDPNFGGFSVWKLDHELNLVGDQPVLKDLRGCCGQMDIQCCDENLVVSENGSFQVGIFDLEGKRLRSFGRQDRTSQNGFGSCCNPMNSMPMSDGTLLTAESSIGHIKHFDLQGNLIAYVGKARIGGGCKHCAMGYDPHHDLYFMQSEDKNEICVLGNREQYPITEAERLVVMRQEKFLDTYAGTWAKEGKKPAQPASNSFFGALFGSSNNDSQDYEASIHPFTSWTLKSDGTVTLHEGQYADFMTAATLELLPAEEGDGENDYRISIAEEQVEYLSAKLSIDGKQMIVEFQPGVSVSLTKVAEACAGENCNGKDCDAENCQGKDCKPGSSEAVFYPPQASAVPASAVPASAVPATAVPATAVRWQTAATTPAVPLATTPQIAASQVASLPTAPQPTMASSFAQPTPKYEYKLVSSQELGEDREAALNELGGNGWEFCTKLGKDLMFKRSMMAQ